MRQQLYVCAPCQRQKFVDVPALPRTKSPERSCDKCSKIMLTPSTPEQGAKILERERKTQARILTERRDEQDKRDAAASAR